MKLTIDTKEDSSEEIKKVIQLLNMLVDGRVPESASNNVFENNNEMPVFGNVFGDDTVEKKEDENSDEEPKEDSIQMY